MYGYKKDPLDPKHIVIDEETAPIVQRIYQMCLSGMGPYQIAAVLSDEKVLCTSYHINNIGMCCRTNLGKIPMVGIRPVLQKFLNAKITSVILPISNEKGNRTRAIR